MPRIVGVLLIALFASMSQFAFAQHWDLMDTTENSLVFLDVASLRMEGLRISAWVMTDYTAPQRDQSGKTYRSTLQQEVVDCASGELGPRVVALYEGHIGRERSIDYMTTPKGNEPMTPMPPGSVGWRTVQDVCRLTRPGTNERSNLDQGQVLLGKDPVGVVTVSLSYVLGAGDNLRSAIVTRSLYNETTVPSIGPKSMCAAYIVNCANKSVFARPPTMQVNPKLACTGPTKPEQLPYIVSASSEAAVEEWEATLVEQLCKAKVTEYANPHSK